MTYPLPLEWDDASEVGGVLVSTVNYDSPSNMDVAVTVLSSTVEASTQGSPIDQFAVINKNADLVVSTAHTFFFVNTKVAPGDRPVWGNCTTQLPNAVFSLYPWHKEIINAVYADDQNARINVTRHATGSAILHICSEELHLTINICMPKPTKLEGQKVWLSRYSHITEISNGTFEKLVTKEETNMSNNGLSIADLMKARRDKEAVPAVEKSEEREESLVKPTEEGNPPWEEETAVKEVESTVAKTSEEPVKLGDTITAEDYQRRSASPKAQEEPAKPVPEQLDDILRQTDELQEVLSDVAGRLKFLKSSVKVVAKQYKAESKTIKRSAEDTRKLEEYDKLAAQLAKLKKFLAE